MSSSLPPLAQALAGGTGSVISSALVYPLDTVTSRLQVATKRRKGYGSVVEAVRTVIREEGWSSLYRGLGADSLSTFSSNAVYFYAWTALHKIVLIRRYGRAALAKRKAPPMLSALEELALGCVAGIIAKGIVAPLSNITVRQQTASSSSQKQAVGQTPAKSAAAESDSDEEGAYSTPSMLDVAREILQDKGWTGFWSGYRAAIVLTLNPSITFYAMQLLQRALIPPQHLDHPRPLQTFLTSATASSIASCVTYPIQLAKTRLQFKSPSGRRLYNSNAEVIAKTIKKHGLKGLYVGLQAQLLKAFAGEGVKMLVKERLERVIVLLYLIVRSRG